MSSLRVTFKWREFFCLTDRKVSLVTTVSVVSFRADWHLPEHKIAMNAFFVVVVVVVVIVVVAC